MQEKINEDYLVILKSGEPNNLLGIDYFPIEKSYQKEFSNFQKKLATEASIKTLLREFKKFYFLLKYYDYCQEISYSYQGVADYTGFKGLRHLLSCSKGDLEDFFITRLNAFRIEETYSTAERLIENGKLLAYSHRKAGWTAQPFNLNEKFQIQFNTNFGFGYVSYFYLVIKYENITIIPYSDWVIYHNANIYEIQRYTQKYGLENKNWQRAMEYCRDLYNLAIADESKFIAKYITEEARKMVHGLKQILNYDKFKLLNLSRDEITIKKEGYKIIEYRAEKISGSLKFISHLKKFSSNRGILEIINEIKDINKELLPVLKRELELINKRLREIEPEYLRLKPIVEELSKRESKIRKIHNEIVDKLHEKYKEKYSDKDRSKEIETQLTKAWTYWKVESDEYFDTHNNKYNPLKREVDLLTPSREAMTKYLEEIENYFKDRL